MAAPSSAPGWPGADSIPESTVVHIPADGSYHGSRDGSYHGGSRDGSHHGSRRGGSRHGDRMSAQMVAAQAAADGKPAPLERVASRRLSNAGSNDYAQDYAGDYPVERDNDIPLNEVAKKYNYNPGHLLHAYFRKWKGGVDDVSHSRTLCNMPRTTVRQRISGVVTEDFVIQALPIPPVYDLCLSYIGAFLGILWVAGCAHALDDRLSERLLVASLGATAVLLYGVSESKLSQPRNVIGTLLAAASSKHRVVCMGIG